MKTPVRVATTIAALFATMLLLGFLSLFYGDRPKGVPYGLLSTGIASLPFLAWWLTGRGKKPPQP